MSPDVTFELLSLEALDLCHLALAEAIAPSAPADADVGLGGADGRRLEALLHRSLAWSREQFAALASRALHRQLTYGKHPLVWSHLFTDADRAELAEMLAALHATGGLLGRALMRDWFRREQDRAGVKESVLHEALSAPLEPLKPESALDYFRRLVPTLGIDPQRYGPDLRRHAFTLAVATERSLLTAVQDVIRGRLDTGQAIRTAPKDVQELLDAAGVSPRNPAYADAVCRTNLMDSYNQGLQQEMDDPDVREMFPVWKYSNPADSRSRLKHAARDGNYYPASVPFTVVRGTEAEDVISCRCTPIPVSKFEWRRLRAKGARIADGFADVPA